MLTLSIFLCIRYIQQHFSSWSLSFYFEFGFRVFKGIGFTFYSYIIYFASFITAFGNSLSCVYSEGRRGEYSFKIFGLSLAFNDFCCLVFLWFCHCFYVLDFWLFLWIVLGCFCCRLRRMLEVSRCCIFRVP